MGDRTVEYSRFFQCDVCKCFGAYDFYGDFICNKCIEEAKKGGEDMGNDLYIETKEGEMIAWLGRKYNYTDVLSDAEINMLFADLNLITTKIVSLDCKFSDFQEYKLEQEVLIEQLIIELEKRGVHKVLNAVKEEGFAKVVSDYEKEGVDFDTFI